MARARLCEVVEGWTGRLTFGLLANGAAPTGTGKTVTAILKGADGSQVDVSGQVDWVSEAAGSVYYDPASGELLVSKSPYSLHFQVTQSGKVVFYPSGAPAYINVYEP